MNADEMPVDDGSPGAEPMTSLVEIRPGVAMVFADRLPDGLDVLPFGMLGEKSAMSLVDQISVSMGAGNLLSQGLAALSNVRGLVRLSPTDLALMESGLKPVKSGPWHLGVFANPDGRFVRMIRFEPATAVQLSSFMSSIGPQAALMTLTMQLAEISQKIDENIELTRDVLKAIHEDQWATLRGLSETTLRAVNLAREGGVVNDHVFDMVSNEEAALRKQRILFAGFVSGHVKALDADAKGSREYIEKNVEAMLADIQGMLMAEWAWYRAQVLRAAHISADHAHAEENQQLLTAFVDGVEEEHEQAMNDITRLLAHLERQCRLMVELPEPPTLPFTNKRRTAREVVAMAEALADRVAALRNEEHSVAPELAPSIIGFREVVPEDVLKILRWSLPDDGPLLAIADVNIDALVGNNAYLGVTPKHCFIARQSSVRRQGVIEQVFALSDIRYVRFAERGKQGPALDIITVVQDIHLTFDNWAATGQGLEDARSIAQLLAAAMNLPESERRGHPLLATGVPKPELAPAMSQE